MAAAEVKVAAAAEISAVGAAPSWAIGEAVGWVEAATGARLRRDRGVAASQSGVRRSCEARGGQVHRMTNGVSRRLRVAKAATAWSWEHGGSGAVMSPLVMPMGGSAVRAGGQSGAGVGVDELVDVLGRHQSFCSQCL